LTVEDYLRLEKASEIRHERIVLNLIRALERQALEHDCELVFDTTKIRTRSTCFLYPDVVVWCAPGNDEYFLENPCPLVEVLSESTANTDTSEKLDEYLKLPGLQRYALVDQTTRRVIVYARAAQGWMVEVLDADGQFDVPQDEREARAALGINVENQGNRKVRIGLEFSLN
jgi:Uma2 family endonuclease